MVTFFLLACVASSAFALDYCAIPVCPPGKHIACNNDGKLAKTCPKEAKIIEFNASAIEAVVGTHNELRNKVAGGNFSVFKPAARMATMVWNDELAQLASLNVYKCKVWNDDCHNTLKFTHSAQSAIPISSKETTSNEETFKKLTEAWFSVYKNATMADIDKAPAQPGSGYFLNMVDERNCAVGCGAVRFPQDKSPGWYGGYFTCNYAKWHYVGSRIYISSAEPASNCKKKNPKYPNLCAEGEYDNKLSLVITIDIPLSP